MASLGEKFTKAFTTFSGIDLTAIFDDRTVLTVSGVSCSITREKAPVYTFGSATPRSISRGKRGIAGSVVATLFDRHAFLDLFLDPRKWYYAHRNEVNWLRNPTNASNPLRVVGTRVGENQLSAGQTGRFELQTGIPPEGFGKNDFRIIDPLRQGVVPNTTFGLGTSPITNVINSEGNLRDSNGVSVVTNTFENVADNRVTIPAGAIVDGQAVTVRRAAVYADQMLPFDLTLVAQNEYGQAAWSSINACEFINEGMGMSVDDITSEQQFTFIAIHCEAWRPLDPAGKELQNVGAQTGFGIDSQGNIAVDSDAGPVDPLWGPFWARDIDGRLKYLAGKTGVPTASTLATAAETELLLPGEAGFFNNAARLQTIGNAPETFAVTAPSSGAAGNTGG